MTRRWPGVVLALHSRLAAPLLGVATGVLVTAGIMFSPPLANAKASYESAYGYERTWTAALRLIRVDNGYKVTEKDDQNGYILFDYKSQESGNKTYPASLELVKGKDAADPVKVIVQIPAMPRYHEQALVDSLAAKLRAEYGDPPKRKEPEKGRGEDAGAREGGS